MLRMVGYNRVFVLLTVGAFAAIGLLFPLGAHSDVPLGYHIYLKDSSGTYIHSCANHSYQNGHVFDQAGALTGNIVEPSLDIDDASGAKIGYLTAHLQ